jgi:hypothetical protein
MHHSIAVIREEDENIDGLLEPFNSDSGSCSSHHP